MLAICRGPIQRVAKSAYTVVIACLFTGLFLGMQYQPVMAANIAPQNQPDRKPGVRFNQNDTGICRVEPGWIEATIIVSLPEGTKARLQAAYHVVQPVRSDIQYIDAGIVQNGDRYTFSSYWPGIQHGNKVVEIHWGAALLDLQTDRPIGTAGLDYFWYPYICEPYAQPEPTLTPVITPTPVPTRQPAVNPSPTRTNRLEPISPPLPGEPAQESSLPTLAPPLNRSEDRFVVLPLTGADLHRGAQLHFFLYMGVVAIGLGCCWRSLNNRR
jgi:hypothetical protein